MYGEAITERKATLTTSVFLLTAAFSYQKPMFFTALIFAAGFFAVSYGTIDITSHINSFYCKYIYAAAFGILVLLINKYNLHIKKGEPFLSLD